MKHIFLLFLLLFNNFIDILAQKDTEFWFVAPDISQNNASNFDRPVAFRMSTYGAAALVTISQPANPLFPPQVVNIPANSSGEYQFTTLFSSVENVPPDQINNKGILIQSTSPISVYYELIGGVPNNPELFSLKGKNALGRKFFIPFQNITDNSASYTPLPRASFNIVATENNTSVTINPTRAIVGHAANTSFTIVLNRGQTFAGVAASQLAAQHPTGSLVTSDKPIAITVTDDLLEGGPLFGGFCRDVMGDQLIPVNKLGTRYIVQKGFLNGQESVFIVASQNNTQIMLDGINVTTISEGQTFMLNITAGSHFIESSSPIYVLQMTGRVCEVAGEIIPPVDCSGSTEIRFIRSTAEEFYLFIATRTGFEDGFVLNYSPSLIQLNMFQPVPGSNGEFVAAVIPFSVTAVPVGWPSKLENTKGLFHAGILNGGDNTGCRFGYFSDYGNQIYLDTTIALCPNQPILLNNQIHTAPDTVQVLLPGFNGVCDTLITYELILQPQFSNIQTIPLCTNETFVIGGQTYSAPATVQFVYPGANGDCDTLTTFQLMLVPPDSITQINIGVCPDETFDYQGAVLQAGDVQTFTFINLAGCDSLVTVSVFQKNTSSNILQVTVCSGETYAFMGQNIAPGDSREFHLFNSEGCDSTLTVFVSAYPTTNFSLNATPSCSNTPTGELFVGVPSGGPAPYRFSLDQVNFQDEPTFDLLSSGNYTVYVQDGNACMVEQEITLPAIPPLQVQLSDGILPCDSPQVRLEAIVSGGVTATYELLWWNGAQTTTATAMEAGVVWVEVTDACETVRQEASVQWAEIGDIPDVVYVPNVFAPASDDPENARFKPYFNPDFFVLNLYWEVFDRWGNLLFRGAGPDEAWEGAFRDKNFAPGVVVWHLEADVLLCGRVLHIQRKGDLMIIR